MKISNFASENDVSINTIRHYIDIGLLLPERRGYHFSFDERRQNDLDEIKAFKDMGFELKEIKALLIFKRLGKMSSLQKDEWYKEIFHSKLDAVSEQLIELEKVKTQLEDKIVALSSEENKPSHVMGVDLRVLELLACPKCSSELDLVEGQIIKNKIINGSLSCSCGTILTIDQGILYNDTLENQASTNIDDHFLVDYLSKTSLEFLENVYSTMEWLYKQIQTASFSSKVVMDLGSGSGFFLRAIYDLLQDDTVYIAVDHDINRHRLLKKIVEMAEKPKNILFVCSDFNEIPLKKSCVDIVIDVMGSSYYAFENSNFLLENIDPFTNDNALLLASFLAFNKFGSHSIIDNALRRNFSSAYVRDSIQALGYTTRDKKAAVIKKPAGKYEDYYDENDEIYNYLLIGERKNKAKA